MSYNSDVRMDLSGQTKPTRSTERSHTYTKRDSQYKFLNALEMLLSCSNPCKFMSNFRRMRYLFVLTSVLLNVGPERHQTCLRSLTRGPL